MMSSFSSRAACYSPTSLIPPTTSHAAPSVSGCSSPRTPRLRGVGVRLGGAAAGVERGVRDPGPGPLLAGAAAAAGDQAAGRRPGGRVPADRPQADGQAGGGGQGVGVVLAQVAAAAGQGVL